MTAPWVVEVLVAAAAGVVVVAGSVGGHGAWAAPAARRTRRRRRSLGPAAVARSAPGPAAGASPALAVVRKGPPRVLVVAVSSAVAIAALRVWPPGVAFVAVPWAMRRWRRRAERRRVAGEVAAEVPELVDLVHVAVSAGLTVPLAVEAAARHAPPRLGRELRAALAEVAKGARLADALARLPDRVGEAPRALVATLVDGARYGTPIGPALDRLAADARASERRRAEERARRVPVLLLFPLVTCVLPAFGLLTVVPLVADGVRALRL